MKITTCLILFLLLSCQYPESSTAPTRIHWDSWGVPHIYSENVEELFQAQGWAQMNNHANHILWLYGRSRGKAAEYWGDEYLQNDMLIHTLGFEKYAREWASGQDPELQTILSSFVKGMNAWAEAHPEEINDENKIVLPLTVDDVNMHGMFVVFTRFIGGSELGRVQQWPDMGSNTYAIGPSRSASGNAMLVQNPHLPWMDEFLFFESHLNLSGRDMYGATLVGFPGIAIGFNESLGWSHTDNTLDNSDTYEVEIQDGRYLLDGEPKEFEKSTSVIKVKQENGELAEQEVEHWQTVHGPVIKKTADKAVALRMVGFDRPNANLQWWRMVNSTNLEEFEEALKMAQIPFWNVMYADRHGDIFYLFNGLVPRRSDGDWNYWNRIVTGGRSSDVWEEVHSYEELPKIKNPSIGWLQNANDPPWTSTIPMTLNPDDFPSYMAPQGMPFRPQRAARMLLDDESITYEELIEYKHSTHLEFADRILDDLATAAENSDAEKAKEAMRVLEKWDREADADSKGMVLFFTWARKFQPWDASNYATGWSSDEPVTTPDGLADPASAVRLLEEAAIEVESRFGDLEVAWGDYYRINYKGKDLPANGIDGSLGVFRVAWPGGGDESHMYVGGGDSWVGVIEFGEQPTASVLLSYGNATAEGSPHVGDQLELFSRKELRKAWITPEEVQANTVNVEVLTAGRFEPAPEE